MLSEKDIAVFDEYIERFMASDLSIIKIKDQKYPINFLRKGLLQRIKDKDLTSITVYIFLSELFMEKV